MRESINSSCNAACMAIDEKRETVQRSLLTSLDKQADDLNVTVAGKKMVREKAASAFEDELKIMHLRLKTALDMASHVTSEGSDCDVASAFKNLTTTLQQLGRSTALSIDLGSVRFEEVNSLKTPVGCLGRIKETEISHPARGRSVRMTNKKRWTAPWKMVRKFGDTGEGQLQDARGVTLNQDGDVAVADYSACRVCIYDIESGKLNTSIDTKQSLHSNPSGYRSFPHGVVVYQGHYIVTDYTYFPTIYNQEKHIRQIQIITNKDYHSVGIAVNSQGHVLVGHQSAQTLEIHGYTDGKQIATLNIPIKAWYIAVSQSDSNIVISANSTDGAQVVDSQGHTIHVLRPPLDVTSDWCPTGVCTIGEGDEEEIFSCNGQSGTGKPAGVYRFSLTTGKYLGCVTTEVSNPRGIAFTEDGRLVVADKTCVKVFAPAE